jgi:uncharacterized coiled-coil protein SlyX
LVAETLETHLAPLPVAPQSGSTGVSVIVVCLSALAVIGSVTVIALPNFNNFVEKSSPEMASSPTPDSVVGASLKEIQSSQQQSAAVLESLTQNSAAQQADLKRISDQLSSLATRMDALQNAATPVTTSAIPQPNARAQVVTPSRRNRSRSPKTAGPVSIGGAPLLGVQTGLSTR